MMTSIENMADEIIKGLTEYADLADNAMKKTVKKTAATVKSEISQNAPADTGAYSKSWATKKVSENSHSLTVSVHSRNRYQIAHLLEHGHAKRNGDRSPAGRRVSDKPHITPAEQKGEQTFEDIIRKALT